MSRIPYLTATSLSSEALATSLHDLQGAVSPATTVRVIRRVHSQITPYLWIPADATVVGAPGLEDTPTLDQVEERILAALEEVPCT